MLLRAALLFTLTGSAHVLRRQETEDPSPSSALPSTLPSSVASAPPTATTESSSIDPNAKGCAAVSQVWKAAEAGAIPAVPPSVAIACLESVPVDVERDIDLIEFLLPYLSFQSTLGYLKKPPKGYLLPPIDLIGGAVAIREKLRKGGYKNQFEFGLDLDRLYSATGDFHFNYSPAILGAFSFQRTLNITSVSSDGLALPKIYDLNDIVQPGDTVSEIVSVDDVPVQDFLGTDAARMQYQDPDAQFNALFWSVASAADTPPFMSAPSLPDSHTVKFANGTTRVYPNVAMIRADFTKIDSGEALHTAVEIPPDVVPAPPAKVRRDDTPAVTAVPGYPEPVNIHQNGYMAGYFLNSSDHSDTAVLVMTSFTPANESEIDALGSSPEYVRTRKLITDFFASCAAAGRTKLIVDVSGNGGGLAFQGFEAYRLLFPQGKAWSGSRVRANAAYNLLGQTAYDTPEELSVTRGASTNPATSQRYPTWKDLYGPASFPEDRQTNVVGYDFTNRSLLTDDDNAPFYLTGSDPDHPAPKQPFAKDDIVVVTDGKCGSTCTIFVGLLQREQGVRTVALGGRPLELPMQAVGGVKGSLVVTIKEIQETWATQIVAKGVSVSSDQARLFPRNDTTAPLMPVDMSGARVNFRNAYAEGKLDGPPVQFLYEAANCKRFYKGEYLVDITAQWRDVADVAWHGAKCVSGSTASSDAKMDVKTPEYTDAVLSKQSVYDGPGSLTNAEWLALAKNLTGSMETLSSSAGRVGVNVATVVAVLVGFSLL